MHSRIPRHGSTVSEPAGSRESLPSPARDEKDISARDVPPSAARKLVETFRRWKTLVEFARVFRRDDGGAITQPPSNECVLASGTMMAMGIARGVPRCTLQGLSISSRERVTAARSSRPLDFHSGIHSCRSNRASRLSG